MSPYDKTKARTRFSFISKLCSHNDYLTTTDFPEKSVEWKAVKYQCNNMGIIMTIQAPSPRTEPESNRNHSMCVCMCRSFGAKHSSTFAEQVNDTSNEIITQAQSNL